MDTSPFIPNALIGGHGTTARRPRSRSSWCWNSAESLRQRHPWAAIASPVAAGDQTGPPEAPEKKEQLGKTMDFNGLGYIVLYSYAMDAIGIEMAFECFKF